MSSSYFSSLSQRGALPRSYPFSYGVFLNWYTSNTFKDTYTAHLPLVGSLSTGIMYLSSVFILPVINRYPRHKKNVMAIGLALCVTGLLGAAFSYKIWHLILTQGIIYALGGSEDVIWIKTCYDTELRELGFLYFPVMSYLFEGFSVKKGLVSLSYGYGISF
jgi:MFS family permease